MNHWNLPVVNWNCSKLISIVTSFYIKTTQNVFSRLDNRHFYLTGKFSMFNIKTSSTKFVWYVNMESNFQEVCDED